MIHLIPASSLFPPFAESMRVCYITEMKAGFLQIDERLIKDKIFPKVAKNEAALVPQLTHCQPTASSTLLEGDLLRSRDEDSAKESLSIFILPSVWCSEGPEEEICSHLFLTAPSA